MNRDMNQNHSLAAAEEIIDCPFESVMAASVPVYSHRHQAIHHLLVLLLLIVSYHISASPLNINVLSRTRQLSAQPIDRRCFSMDSIQFSATAASVSP